VRLLCPSQNVKNGLPGFGLLPREEKTRSGKGIAFW
jgi:hypothetical protein